MLMSEHGGNTRCQAAGLIFQHTELMANQTFPCRRHLEHLDVMPFRLQLILRRGLPVHTHMQAELIVLDVLVIALLIEQLRVLYEQKG